MAVSSKDIKAAVGLLDVEDATLWAAPGVPTLAALQLVAPEATAADLRKAGFAVADEGDGGAPAANKETGADPAAQAASDDTLVQPEALPHPDEATEEQAMAIVDKARAALRAVDADIAAAHNARAHIVDGLAKMVRLRDVQLHRIETYSAKVSFAASVKAIQKQTQLQLLERKEKARLLAEANLAAGTVFPSALDASLAARRKTPQQTANLAAFINQQSQRQIEERG